MFSLAAAAKKCVCTGVAAASLEGSWCSSVEDMEDLLVRLFRMSGWGIGTLLSLAQDGGGAISAAVVTALTVTGAAFALSDGCSNGSDSGTAAALLSSVGDSA